MALFLVELALLIATLLFIAYPLYRRDSAAVSGQTLTESDYSDLLYRKEAAYTALIDLEFDYKTGKIDDNDYKTMKSSMETEAINLLKRVDAHEKGSSIPTVPASSSVSSSRTVPESDAKHFCPNCGSAVAKEHKFCVECGTGLPA
ncbi:hypothetical protein MNBD_NITROSPINAE03-1777 [hydrothermal vent metagenome]|uniref:Zinc-ribbon domain-containing protein n=1 Tax=hydrothermal vent metagenome TaxID=652676 RepID=A0A3B1C582_9ZZZZ